MTQIDLSEVTYGDRQGVLHGVTSDLFTKMERAGLQPKVGVWYPGWCSCTLPIWTREDASPKCKTCDPSGGCEERIVMIEVMLRGALIGHMYAWFSTGENARDVFVGYKWMVYKRATEFGIPHCVVEKGKHKPYHQCLKWLRWYLEQSICKVNAELAAKEASLLSGSS